ncbi:hypothetical protein HK096_006521 [Nowakowskiella sp. JEL0078]|nr:hypothetical protein HK096_006521 [Nowakowskiella sp. JEL0078]
MAFSGAVVLADLDDFISPSQACIKPAEVIKVASVGKAKTEIRVDGDGSYFEMADDGIEVRLEKAKITLNDCLACSGCVTSAESILITMQNSDELYQVLNDNSIAREQQLPQKVVVISLSPQSRSSFASKYELSQQSVHQKLQWFFKQHLGAHYFFDTSFSRDFSLLESAKEFVTRYQQTQNKSVEGVLPMLASSCPGWICYSEKTHSSILSHIDTTKSPQQIMGSLVKDLLASQIGCSPENVYHVTIMPCYDKKLEASRSDFYNEIYSTKDVDCVITTGEVEQMLADQGFADVIVQLDELPIESMFTKTGMYELTPVLLGTEGTSAGGYISFIFRYAAYHLFGITLSITEIEHGIPGLVERIPGRNSDTWDLVLYQKNLQLQIPVVALRFGVSYGFRNIQNLVRKVKPNTGVRRRKQEREYGGVEYHFVEVMACPSACVNGGGQLKPGKDQKFEIEDVEISVPWSVGREWVEKTENVYRELQRKGLVQPPEESLAVKELYCNWLGGENSEKAKKMLHTQYHAVNNTIASGLGVKW